MVFFVERGSSKKEKKGKKRRGIERKEREEKKGKKVRENEKKVREKEGEKNRCFDGQNLSAQEVKSIYSMSVVL